MELELAIATQIVHVGYRRIVVPITRRDDFKTRRDESEAETAASAEQVNRSREPWEVALLGDALGQDKAGRAGHVFRVGEGNHGGIRG